MILNYCKVNSCMTDENNCRVCDLAADCRHKGELTTAERVSLADEREKHFKRITAFASRLLDLPDACITVEQYDIDADGLYSATVTIPYGDGVTTEYIHEYHD